MCEINYHSRPSQNHCLREFSAKMNNIVQSLIQRYENLVKTHTHPVPKPIFRRSVSTNSARKLKAVAPENISLRLDKAAIPRNKPVGNGWRKDEQVCDRECDGAKKSADPEKSEKKAPHFTSTDKLVKRETNSLKCHANAKRRSISNPEFTTADLNTLEPDTKSSSSKVRTESSASADLKKVDQGLQTDQETTVFRKNAKIGTTTIEIKLIRSKESATKYKPIKPSSSIEDFETKFYFDDSSRNDIAAIQNEAIPDNPEKSIELARQKAKEEEERYRRSFVDEEEFDEAIFAEDAANTQAGYSDENSEEQIECDEEIPIESHLQQKLLRKKDKKEYVVSELIETEKSYIQHLELVIRNYLHYLKRQRFDSEKIDVVFSNIGSIHTHSQIFLIDLEYCNYNYAEIGKVFCKHRDLFDKYPKYCKDRNKSYNLITTELKEIVAHRQLELSDKLGLNSSLLKPIQRLAKYELLLINLDKLLEEEGTDVANLKNAITLIQRTARIADTMVILNTIQKCPHSYNSIGPFLFKDQFRLLHPEKTDVAAFLFNKMLIFTEKAAEAKEEYNFKYGVPVGSIRLNHQNNSSVLSIQDFDGYKKPCYTIENKDSKIVNVWKREIQRMLWRQYEKCKGNVQHRADFLTSLNHFKNIDTTDSNGKAGDGMNKYYPKFGSGDSIDKQTNIRNTMKQPSSKNSQPEGIGTYAKLNLSPKNRTIVQKPNKNDAPKPTVQLSLTGAKKKESSKNSDVEKRKQMKKSINRKMAIVNRM